MEVADFEQIVAVSESGEGSDLELLEIRGNLLEFIKSIDIFQFFIENLANEKFTQQNSVVFLLKSIRKWFTDQYSEIPDELIEVLKQFLFQTCVANFSKYDNIYAVELISTQVKFIMKSFPEKWPNFWEEFFAFDENYILRFLEIFCLECSFLTPERLQTFSAFKAALTESGVIEKIYSICFEKMKLKVPIAFSIISSLCTWTDFTWISVEDSFGALLLGFEEKECIRYVFRTFNNIIMRNMSDESKIELIGNLGNVERIAEICESSEDEGVYCDAAKLVYSAGLLLLNDESSQQYYQLAVKFLEISQEVAITVIPFISTVTKLYLELVPDTIEAAFTLLIAFFNELCESEEKYFPDVESKPYLNKICSLISVCITSDLEASISFIDEMISENFNIEENPGLCTAVMYSTMVCQQTTPGFTDILKRYMEPLLITLQIEAPVPPSHQFMCYLFIKLFTDNHECFPVIRYQEVCAFLLNYIVIETLPEMVVKECSDFIRRISSFGNTLFEISEEHIQAFMGTLQPHHVAAAAALMKFLDPETRERLISGYLDEFVPMLSNEETQTNACACLLEFIASISREDAGELNEVLIENLKACLPLIEGHDSLIASYIKATSTRLGSLGLENVLEVQAGLCGPLSIIFFTKFISNQAISQIKNPELLAQVLPPLMTVVFRYIDFVINGLDNTISKNVFGRMCFDFFSFIRKVCGNLEEEVIGQILAQIESLLTNSYSIESVFDSCIMFLSSLISTNAELLLEPFIQLSFNIVLLPNFDPNDQLYMKLCNRISCFHRDLSNVCPEQVVQVLTAVLSCYGLGGEEAAAYIAVQKEDARKSKDGVRKFFQELMRLKKSIEF